MADPIDDTWDGDEDLGRSGTEQNRTPRLSVKIPEHLEKEPSVQISMGVSEQSVVRPPPRRYDTGQPFVEDHWTPGLNPMRTTETFPPPFLGVPLPPKLPELAQPVATEVARGSTDVPVVADQARGSTDIPVIAAPQPEPEEVIELHHSESGVVAADRAIEKLEPMQRRNKRHVIAAVIAAPALLGLAFYLGRRASADELAPPPPKVQPVPVQPAMQPPVDNAAELAPPPKVQPAPVQPAMQPPVDNAAERALARSLLERADIAIRNGRVASPPGDNALEDLLDAEKLEPGSQRAKAVRQAAVAQLLGSAEQLWNAGKLESARTLYSDALLFDPSIEIAKTRSRRGNDVVVDDMRLRRRGGVQPAIRAASSERAPSPATGGSKDVAWLVAEIDLAIIERRLVAPAGRNALELLQQLRRVDPTNQTVRRLGGEITQAIVAESEVNPNDTRLQAAAKSIVAKPAVPAPEPQQPVADEKPRDPALARPPQPVADEKPRDPALAHQLVAKGNTLLGSGRLGEARAEFERAVAADSTAHSALAGLAEVAYNESDYTRAVLSAKRAIALAPAFAGYRMLLGKAYYKLLRYEDAIAQWKKAIELEPANTAAQKNIEMAQRRMGG